MAQALLEEFHATHPNIRVFTPPDPENVEGMLADMQAGNSPTSFRAAARTFHLGAKGYNLTCALCAGRPRSVQHRRLGPGAIPVLFHATASSMACPSTTVRWPYYNKDLYPTGSITPMARTYDDYREAMRRLTKQNDSGQVDTWGSMVDVSWDCLQITSTAGWLFQTRGPHPLPHVGPEAMGSWLHDRMRVDNCLATLPRGKDGPRSGFYRRQAGHGRRPWALGYPDERLFVSGRPSQPARCAG